MIFDIKNLKIETLKKFDGIYNYFNVSCFNNKTIFRRESKFKDKLLISDIVDNDDNIIIEHNFDQKHLLCYEDARFINENEISVSCCIRDISDLIQIKNVEFKKYNLKTKQFTHFKTQNECFEKNWQFYNDKIIYHVNPYTIMDNNENIIYKKQINWHPWIKKYGNPGLSTNIFEVNDTKYLLFHSHIKSNGIVLKYYCGLLRLNDDLTPLSYTIDCLFDSVSDIDPQTFIDYFNWKRKLDCCPTIVDIVFPMNVIVNNENIDIYSGLNDCCGIKISIDKNIFMKNIQNVSHIMV